MCQARMGILILRQFPAFCTIWRVSELLQNILRDFHVPWHWAFINKHAWWFIPTQYWTRNIRQCISQNSRGCHREPFIASKSSIVVGSGIAFTALDLITRPSPFRATMCSSVWKRFPSHVSRCHLSVMRPTGTFPATLNITKAQNGRSSPRCGRFFSLSYADLPSLADLKGQKRSTLVISSTDRIPRSMRPLDCESATGECSNNVPRDPRRFAISLKTSTIAG